MATKTQLERTVDAYKFISGTFILVCVSVFSSPTMQEYQLAPSIMNLMKKRTKSMHARKPALHGRQDHCL